MRLSPNQLEKMNAYVGCGPHLDADILIMGNEEGTGGYPTHIETNAVARFRLYGKEETTVSALLDSMAQDKEILCQDDLYPNEQYECSVNGNWKEGFWEKSARSGGEKIKRYMKNYFGYDPEKSKEKPSLFNTYTARLCLTLEGIKNDPHFPIETFLRSDETKTNEINEYADNQLYTSRPGGSLSTALMDWRPLPRPNEGVWPPEYHSLFESESEYLRAYRFNKSATDKAREYVNKRLDYLKSVIVHSRANTLITIGQVDNKINMLRRMFPEQELVIERIPISKRSYTTKVLLPNRTLHIYILSFFKFFPIEDLLYVAKQHLVPDFFDRERPTMETQSICSTVLSPSPQKIKKKLSSRKQTNSEQTDGLEERRFLVELAKQMKVLEPDIQHTSAYRDNRADYNYMFMWFGDKQWGNPKCKAEIHVNFKPEVEVELSWRIRPDQYEQPLRANLIHAAESIGNELSKLGFKRNTSAKLYIEFHKVLQRKQDEELLNISAAELRSAMNLAREIMTATFG
ncbi:hypothetical protein FHS15_003909 [Paenibacillus castaneae]|uniref:hypothetical protein n=1 Tax=Paenibacillus castaneae TaxID=474957 RepID=UPI000C9B9FC8|nr:hypothetical protein [Paenibacillus castaneae]NIK78763.1 hypothetical protein [Paenibacillus castaneae]